MFDSIGSKIKSAASIVFWFNTIVSILLGLCIIFDESRNSLWLSGVIVMIIGIFVSYFSSLLFYGFGELIENIKELLVIKKVVSTKRKEELKKLQADGLITKEQYYDKIRYLE